MRAPSLRPFTHRAGKATDLCTEVANLFLRFFFSWVTGELGKEEEEEEEEERGGRRRRESSVWVKGGMYLNNPLLISMLLLHCIIAREVITFVCVCVCECVCMCVCVCVHENGRALWSSVNFCVFWW